MSAAIACPPNAAVAASASLAREAGLRRDKLYVTFGGDTEPYLYRVMALLNALGVGLTVKAKPPRPIPPRPKLGRPRKAKSEPSAD